MASCVHMAGPGGYQRSNGGGNDQGMPGVLCRQCRHTVSAPEGRRCEGRRTEGCREAGAMTIQGSSDGPLRPSPDGAKSGQRWILVVDDNEQLRKELGRLLELEGWKVTLCPDGPLAVQSAVKRDYDVALIDFSIPGIRGAVVAETIRALNPRACIIGISFQDRREEFLTAGADAFLLKPFDLEEVLTIVARKNGPTA